MKKISFLIVLFSTFMNAQNTFPTYSELWKEVDQLELDNLPKSANEKVEKIYQLAKKEQNSPQIIKSLLFQSKFAMVLEEDSQLNVIHRLEKEIAEASFPTNNLLESILANLYWQYFQENRWRFYNRTETAKKVDATDFRTWDLNTIFKEIHFHFDNSLQNENLLKSTDLNQFEAILIEGKNSKLYRPTLYDFLVYQALDFYQTDENSITQPAYKFEIDNPSYLSEIKTFSNLKLESKDSTSLVLKTLELYQSLIQFHLNDTQPFALIQADLDRLHFVHTHATFSEKDKVFMETLKKSKNQFLNNENSTLYDFEIAKLYQNEGNTYHFETNPNVQWQLKEAISVCDDAVKWFPQSVGSQECTNLKTEILSESLLIKTENYISENSSARLYIEYKNVDNLKFKALKISDEQRKKIQEIYNDSSRYDFLKSLSINKEWSQNLRNLHDFQLHSTEILLPAQKSGLYVILAEIPNTETYAFAFLQVTDFVLVELQNTVEHRLQLVNRTTGKPYKGAKIHLKNIYTNNYNKTFDKSFVTNENGYIILPKDHYYSYLQAKVTYDKKSATFGYYNINQRYNDNSKRDSYYQVSIFTDRSIYRPGQKVYFKGIVFENKPVGKKYISNVVSKQKMNVNLLDVNWQVVQNMELTTNEFGSVSGEFVLPENVLTGYFRVQISGKNGTINGNEDFSVEEYKRPKFETEFKPVSGTFKVNDNVEVTGSAMAFAGSTISDAKVVYRVHRMVRYPRWWYWYRPYFYSEPQEITHGETITDAKGEFKINFIAQPDASVDAKSQPIFNYEITAEVTDINGETHTATTVVNVGYHSMELMVSTSNNWNTKEDNQKISIAAQNLNGEKVPSNGVLKIYKLQAPSSVKRVRPWSAPDLSQWTEKEFNTLFPYDSFTSENNVNSRKLGEKVYEISFITDKENKEILIGKEVKKWMSGNYQIVVESKDAFGNELVDKTNFNLIKPDDKKVSDNQIFTTNLNKTTYRVGDIAVLTLGSASEEASVFVLVEKDKKIVKTIPVVLHNEVKTLEFPILESDLGGFSILSTLVNHNSYISENYRINVEEKVENLSIETLTFRDKMQPGSEQTWSFKIKGLQKDQKMAEILASMYDASLDQFRVHQWTLPHVYQPNYWSSLSANARQSFDNSSFSVYRMPQKNYLTILGTTFDELNWFGYSLNFNRWQYTQYLKTKFKDRSGIGEEFTIKGNVTDSIENLPGCTIRITGTNISTETDFDGNFILDVKKGDVLEIDYIGMNTVFFTIVDNGMIKVKLYPYDGVLDEVVVTAFGKKVKKETLGYAVVEEKMEDSIAAPAAAELGEGGMRIAIHNIDEEDETGEDDTKLKKTDFSDVKIRTNFNETAFFYPQIKTDAEGNFTFSFTSPESLTRWKLQLLGHTTDMKTAYQSRTSVTQKELMLLPNPPRFLREGDQIVFSTKISNISEKPLQGVAKLELTDAVSGENIDLNLANNETQKSFSVDAKGNTQVSWTLQIPFDVQAVQYKIVAKADDFSDGEQNALPVLSNRMLVTETLPMCINSKETKTFTLDKLKNNTSTTLQNHKLTLEVTSHPVWYAIQALPYLMEYPYECSEQTFSRYYANALATKIVKDNPKIEAVFHQWENADVLMSNLEKNEELKSLLIAETPWLRDAQSETEQQKRIAMLFDLKKMSQELEKSAKKLYEMQFSDGGFPWFKGSRFPDRYITQHIAAGFGHLEKLGVFPIRTQSDLSFDEGKNTHEMLVKAVQFLDAQIIEDYEYLEKQAKIKLETPKNAKQGQKDADEFMKANHLGAMQLHYLYTRTFYNEVPKSERLQKVVNYYTNQAQQYWKEYSLYQKGLIALVLQRSNQKSTAQAIVKSLDENSITHPELGMYWKDNKASWYWYQAPIETQALMIETFAEVKPVQKQLDLMKVWLLKNKQTNRWETTKSTTEAVFALLAYGTNWTVSEKLVEVKVGTETITPTQTQAGSGYFKTSWNANDIKPEQAQVTLTKTDEGIAWGGLYWQYFENLDKITFATTPLQLSKKLFIKQNTDTGEKLVEINDGTEVKVGDLVRVRIELKVDREMEFVHMKDMRASGFEPVNVLSEYKYQDGLGYYESTKDAATNFFFSYLNKGVYVFEYDLRANNAGDFSNGITTIQCMYAPEFTSHSEGVRVNIINSN